MQIFHNQTGVKVSVSTTYRFLKKLKISIKKSLCASEQEREDINKRGYEYRKWLDLIDIHNLVFVDESGVN